MPVAYRLLLMSAAAPPSEDALAAKAGALKAAAKPAEKAAEFDEAVTPRAKQQLRAI